MAMVKDGLLVETIEKDGLQGFAFAGDDIRERAKKVALGNPVLCTDNRVLDA
jgi:hypothetical protein